MSKQSMSLNSAILETVVCPFVTVVLFLSCGCDQSFDAIGPLDKRMVVYSVFSTDRNDQYVLVQQSYSVPDYNPLSHSTDNSLDDVLVALNAPNGTHFFTDTLLPRPDTSRYKFPIRSFVLKGFTPTRGVTYEIVVQSKSLCLASASVTIPESSQITALQGVEQVLNNTGIDQQRIRTDVSIRNMR